MAIKISNILAALAFMMLLTGLYVNLYNDFSETYDLTRTYTKNGKDIIQTLNELKFIQGMDDIVEGLYKIGSPTGGEQDVLGGLTAVAGGFLKVSFGALILPFDLFGAITGFYTIPGSVPIIMGFIVSIYVGFVLIRNYLGQEN